MKRSPKPAKPQEQEKIPIYATLLLVIGIVLVVIALCVGIIFGSRPYYLASFGLLGLYNDTGIYLVSIFLGIIGFVIIGFYMKKYGNL